MARGSQIIVTSEPKGTFMEGIISGALLPGVKMQVKANVLPVGGRFTWEAYNPAADNDPRLTAILLDDNLQGKLMTDAYVSGTRCFMYCPLPGEDMNVLVEAEAGTGSANAWLIGDRLQPVHGTGQYKRQSTSANRADFVVFEHIDNLADVAGLVWAKFQ